VMRVHHTFLFTVQFLYACSHLVQVRTAVLKVVTPSLSAFRSTSDALLLRDVRVEEAGEAHAPVHVLT